MKITSQPSNGIDLNVTFDGRTFTLPRLIEHVRNLESAQDQLVGEQEARDRHPAGKGVDALAAAIRLAEARNSKARRRFGTAIAALATAEEDVAYSENRLLEAHANFNTFVNGGQA